jgi:hypothetical protein
MKNKLLIKMKRLKKGYRTICGKASINSFIFIRFEKTPHIQRTSASTLTERNTALSKCHEGIKSPTKART